MNIDNINDLPEKYRKQAEIKLNKMTGPICLDQPKRSKHGNVKTKVCGITFDSKAEASRYIELKAMLKTGEISRLKLQPTFTLQESFKTVDGELVRARHYKADFSYYKDGQYIVEDVKSEHTRKLQSYRDKRKEIQDKFGITITEVVT